MFFRLPCPFAADRIKLILVTSPPHPFSPVPHPRLCLLPKCNRRAEVEKRRWRLRRQLSFAETRRRYSLIRVLTGSRVDTGTRAQYLLNSVGGEIEGRTEGGKPKPFEIDDTRNWQNEQLRSVGYGLNPTRTEPVENILRFALLPIVR